MVNYLPRLIIFILLGGVAGAQELPHRLWQPVQEYFTIVTPAGNGRQKRHQRVNPFLSYTHLGTDFGFVGPAESEIGWQPGMVCATLPATVDGWAGMWHSLSRLARIPEESLSFAKCFPGAILDPFQPRIVGLRLTVMGRGDIKVEIKDARGQLLWESKFAVKSESLTAMTAVVPTDAIKAAKFVNWTAEPGSDLCIDNLGFEVEPPKIGFDQFVFLTSYAKAVRCYSPATGLMRDRAHTEDGAFDSIPATGLFTLSTAVAARLGMVSPDYARTVLRKALATAGSIEGPYGLLPHFARRAEGSIMIHPGTEFSTVDTAIFHQATLLAARINGDDESSARVRAAMKRTDLGPLRNSTGYVSHGVRDDRETLLPFIWKDWGGESALVLLLQQYASGGQLKPMMDDRGRVHQGCGFVAEIQSLLFPDFDQQTPDAISHVNWRQSRLELLRDQKSYFERTQPDDGWARRNGIYGLSSGEGVYGISYQVSGVDLPAQTLIHPHYILMSATLEPDPKTVYTLLSRMQGLNLLPPWGLVENVLADGSEYLPLLGALNANFESLGAYHLLAKNRGMPDVIHQAATESPEFREMVKIFYPALPL